MRIQRRKLLIAGLVSALMPHSRVSFGQQAGGLESSGLESSGLEANVREAGAQQADEKWAIPGGVAQLKLNKQSDQQPVVKFGLYEPVVLEFDDHWRIIVGLDLNTLPGDYLVHVKMIGDEAPAFPVKFSVQQHRYTVKSISAVPEAMARSTPQLSDIDFINTVPPALPLLPPVNQSWRNDFGVLWVSEDDATKMIQQNFVSLDPQAGQAAAAQVVQAPQNGIISRITSPQDNRQTGYSVHIDHGRGLYSLLHGLEDITVETGNGVVAGAVLGKIKQSDDAVLDSTNTANGLASNSGQLTWQCVMNGVYVNPLILTEIT